MTAGVYEFNPFIGKGSFGAEIRDKDCGSA
jgi:hypothetical protein